jgi:C-terminal processing protease CtpA/Prc
MREWYLFPETLPAAPNPASFTNLDDWTDALTATARGQGRDRFFTYVTSIAEENAFYNSGSSAGFGFRLGADPTGRRAGILEAFEGAPALAAGLDRGTEILAIGTSEANLRAVSDIIAAEGTGGINNALGPSDVGVKRVLRVSDAGGTRNVTLSKTEYDIAPISSRTGVRVLDGPSGKVGYVNLRTFINPAEPALKSAFAQFKAQGVRDFIIDLRYNGGGLLSVAGVLGDLIGGGRSSSDIQSRVVFRPEKSAENETRTFRPLAETVTPRRIAFIGTGGTASASELVINAMIPYLGADVALIGTNTFGKPVGQIALDQAACDDRLRVVAFSTRNRDDQGDYYNGIAPFVRSTCEAIDDAGRPLGDPAEASTQAALNFIAGRSCTPIGTGAATTGVGSNAIRTPAGTRELVSPMRPRPSQREVPGSF